jgi:ribonuclease P protein component
MKNNKKNIRIGITTGKKIGNAVKRSRARRVIRAAFRELYPNIREGFDFVFVARGKTPFVKSNVVRKAMEQHMKSAGVLRE